MLGVFTEKWTLKLFPCVKPCRRGLGWFFLVMLVPISTSKSAYEAEFIFAQLQNIIMRKM